ncbi:U4/U6 small nuclear ribonucleoprotein prp4 [Coemansia sp. RSA 1646]|nr:U4/U6 small nuclear ribonucleoprotein prp4 [Coemansia sp. RSA 1646]KAJ1771372.1 U4/U6 small nuclear ribonucleoprotein prp4 [Coemansia sp. RSA 1843]KAJ2093145.1 U4/U6 small nuclear ribonucleoprotein prp4 [Coemansia sp. RSA 986]KAJ2217589.1 U4/U6 small nuclear ribonucleoprotein prp4 [Coemansia sp. RSA 487]
MHRHHGGFDTEDGEITNDHSVSPPRSDKLRSSAGAQTTNKPRRPTSASVSASTALLSRTPLAKSRRREPYESDDKRTRRRSRSPDPVPRSRPSEKDSSKDKGSATAPPSKALLDNPKTSIATNATVESFVNGTLSIDEGFKLSFEKDDDPGEEERLLEERRRRRREIMMMHRTQTDSPTTPSSDTIRNISRDATEQGNSLKIPAADSTVAEGVSTHDFALEKVHGNPSDSIAQQEAEGISAADCNPNTDSNADDMRHRMIAKAAQNIDMKRSTAALENTQAPKATSVHPAGPQKGSGGEDDDDDDFDMFADDDVEPEKATLSATLGGRVAKSSTGASLVSMSAMADSWDDAEGYYRTVVGELLDDRYLVQSFLGQGVFSSVVKALDTKNQNAPVAIKIIRQNDLMRKAGLKEQRILERLAEADPSGKMHVVRLLESFVHCGHLCLSFELMSLNLREVVRKYGRDSGLNLQAVRVYAMHLLLALDLLRRSNVTHGDLKPDNCFVSDQRNNVKLGDLGSACDVSENEITPYLVSRFYRAPEIMLGMQYNCAIDVWSLGATLFELYTGKILFPGRNNNHMLQLMMETRGHFPNRMLRRGQFWQQHFEDNGGSMLDFVSRTTDRLTGSEVVQRMTFAKPKNDIKSRVLQATPAGSSSDEIQLALQFASLLDRCLELSPEKRITPIEALRHAFFSQK